ncbi:MAG: hypothetical protein HC765_10450, partial [Brachymonas sp.]|nr:hypothetical protein [Brachymonas sp.]
GRAHGHADCEHGYGNRNANSNRRRAVPTPFNWTAGYDNRNRLTSFNRAGSEQAYTYDANSNRLTSIAKKISDTDIDGIFEATDRAATTSQALNIAANSNKLLGFNQSVLTQATTANGTRANTQQRHHRHQLPARCQRQLNVRRPAQLRLRCRKPPVPSQHHQRRRSRQDHLSA